VKNVFNNMFLVHGTSEEDRAIRILGEGLKPTIQTGLSTTFPTLSDSRLIYFVAARSASDVYPKYDFYFYLRDGFVRGNREQFKECTTADSPSWFYKYVKECGIEKLPSTYIYVAVEQQIVSLQPIPIDALDRLMVRKSSCSSDFLTRAKRLLPAHVRLYEI